MGSGLFRIDGVVLFQDLGWVGGLESCGDEGSGVVSGFGFRVVSGSLGFRSLSSLFSFGPGCIWHTYSQQVLYIPTSKPNEILHTTMSIIYYIQITSAYTDLPIES